MPFVGETGGRRAGRAVGAAAAAGPRAGPRARPGGPAGRPGADRAPGRGPAPGRGTSRPRRAARPAAREDAAVTGAIGARPGDRHGPRPGRRRHADGPGPGPGRPRLPPPRAPARPAHPGPRRRLLRPGRPQGARSTWSSSARRRACATTPRPARPPRGRGRPSRTGAPGSTRSWSRSRRRRPALAGETLPYLDHVARCFAYAPPRYPDDAMFEAAAARIDALLPGDAPLADRLAAWDARFVDPGRSAAGASSTGSSRASAARRPTDFGLPDGEDLRVSLVTGQPWSAYNWFDGGRRSRVDVNTDLPGPRLRPDRHWSPTRPTRATTSSTPGRRPTSSTRRAASSRRSCSSTRPSASSARAWPTSASRFARHRPTARRPARRAVRAGRPRRSPPTRRRRARPPNASVALAERARAARRRSAATPRSSATPTGGRTTRSSPTCATSAATRAAAAAKRLEFIEHPLWRTYVFVYAEGEALLRRWLEAVPEPRARRPVRAPAPRAADAGRGHSSRLKTTRSSPSAS